MMKRREFLATPSLALALGGETPRKMTFVPLKLHGLWGARLGFALDPPADEWAPAGAGRFGGGGYTLEIETQSAAGETRIEFRLRRDDGRPFLVQGYSARAGIDFTGVYRAWYYRGGALELMSEFDAYMRGLGGQNVISAANSGIPIAVCTDRNGQNRFTMGMLDQVETTALKFEPFNETDFGRAEGLNYAFEFVKPYDYSLKRTELRDGIYLSRANATWFDTVGRYAEWVEQRGGIRVLPPPPEAYQSIWNTWYPFGQNIDEKMVWENAKICKRLGIANIFVDAGYNNPLTGGMSNAAEVRLFNDYTGDWSADKKKFPDFRGLVGRIHDQNQLLTVWVALFLLGKSTKAYAKVRGMLMRGADGSEGAHLCPRHPDTASYLAETFGKLARDYDLDGFWLDFMDGMHSKCYGGHPHWTESPGEGYNRCLAAVRDTVLGFKRNFLIETRMKMSNINAKAFVNVLETSDMPYDFDLNRALGVFVQSFGKGSAVKIDPAEWHVRESPENVAKFCATVIACGVPVLGVDFRILPERHLRVVEAWLRFHREQGDALSRGHREPVGFERLFPQLCVTGGGKTFVYSGSASTAPVTVRGDEVYVLNASDSDRVVLRLDGLTDGRWRAAVRDCYLETAREAELTASGNGMMLDEKIPQGGMIELKRA